MDFSILDENLSKLNRKLQREHRKVVLFLDNPPCHHPDMKGKHDQIKIVFSPPNCTSILYPLDLGIIQGFKFKYMKLILINVVSRIHLTNVRVLPASRLDSPREKHNEIMKEKMKMISSTECN